MGGGAFSFRLLGFPVSIHGSFLLIVGVIGYSWFTELDGALAFIVIAVFAILVHELGHAVASRSQGVVGSPTITLAGMGGLTRYQLLHPPSRAQSILISAAGPLAGIAMGFAVLGLRATEFIDSTSFNDSLFQVALFTTFGWSAFNLLPIVPLDGGHIMTDLIPGAPLARRRRASVVSIAVAVITGGWLYLELRAFIAPLILGLFAYQNYTFLRASGSARPTAPVTPQGDPPAEG